MKFPIINSTDKQYIKKFIKMSIFDQIQEIKKNPIQSSLALDYLHNQITLLGCMALSSGTSLFEKYKIEYENFNISNW